MIGQGTGPAAPSNAYFSAVRLYFLVTQEISEKECATRAHVLLMSQDSAS